MKKVNVKRKLKTNVKSSNGDSQLNDTEDLRLNTFLPLNLKIVEKPILPGDTLQTLALRFNSSISELKRLNNLIRDNEIFAKRTIKIPFKLLNCEDLDDHLAQVHSKRDFYNENNINKNLISSTCETSLKLFEKDINSIMNNNAIKNAAIKNHQMNLEKGFAKWQTSINHHVMNENIDDDDDDDKDDDNVNQYLLNESSSSIGDTKTILLDPVQILQLNGTDGGLSWRHLFICVLCLCLLAPMVYVLYIADVFTEKVSQSSPNPV